MATLNNNQQQQQTNNTTATIPTFVKSLLLLVLPSNKQSHQRDKQMLPQVEPEDTSPFEKMYFSFPALAEEEGSVAAISDSAGTKASCGQHSNNARHLVSTSHHQHQDERSKANNSIIC